MFYDPRKYELFEVGRLKFNIKLGLKRLWSIALLTAEDFYAVIEYCAQTDKKHRKRG